VEKKPLSSINTMGVMVCWGLVEIIVGQCLRCHATFINGKQVPNLHVETKLNCSHTLE